MRRAARRLVGLVGPMLLLAAGSAQADFDFVGFSTASTTGNLGITGMHELCQADYTDSRMCSSQEILDSTRLPPAGTLVPSYSWIAPSIRGGLFDGVQPLAIDASGESNGPGDLSCNAWTNTGASGLAYSPRSYISIRSYSCSLSMPVACCARVAGTIVPAMASTEVAGRMILVAAMVAGVGMLALRRQQRTAA
jgi:hypothetical protein